MWPSNMRSAFDIINYIIYCYLKVSENKHKKSEGGEGADGAKSD